MHGNVVKSEAASKKTRPFDRILRRSEGILTLFTVPRESHSWRPIAYRGMSGRQDVTEMRLGGAPWRSLGGTASATAITKHHSNPGELNAEQSLELGLFWVGPKWLNRGSPRTREMPRSVPNGGLSGGPICLRGKWEKAMPFTLSRGLAALIRSLEARRQHGEDGAPRSMVRRRGLEPAGCSADRSNTAPPAH